MKARLVESFGNLKGNRFNPDEHDMDELTNKAYDIIKSDIKYYYGGSSFAMAENLVDSELVRKDLGWPDSIPTPFGDAQYTEWAPVDDEFVEDIYDIAIISALDRIEKERNS